MINHSYRLLENEKCGNKCRSITIVTKVKKFCMEIEICDNGYIFYLAGVAINQGVTNNEHLSTSDNASTVSMSMNNPGGNASTYGVLTVTLEDSNNTSKQPEIKSVLKKRSSGSVTSGTSYPNNNFANKYV